MMRPIPFGWSLVGGVCWLMLAVIMATVDSAAVNNRPVVGILSQESHPNMKQYGQEYLMSEYVKYLEMAGASVVVVKGGQPLKYYIKLFHQINGVLFPGGGVGLINSTYARSAGLMYSMAVNANDHGDFFPIWGTCQGFEELTVLTAGKDVLSVTDSENLPLPLTLLPEYKDSRLLGKAPDDIIKYLTTEKVTANFHHFCLASKVYKMTPSLNKFYKALSVNKGRKGTEFVSTMEAYNYPFYGVQWHPEKNIFTRDLTKVVAHTADAVRVAQYFANFFVDEARKNFHNFATEYERSHTVMENDKRVFLPKNYIENFFFNVTKS